MTSSHPTVVIDTSAVIAILQGEPSAAMLARTIAAAGHRLMSSAGAVEASVVALARRRSAEEVERFIDRAEIEIVPVSAAHVRAAVDGFLRYGKGRHPAGLNFGDCFSYALARVSGHGLLFIGDDFSKTDIAAVPFASGPAGS